MAVTVDDSLLGTWKKLIDEFQIKATQDLNEVRQYKQDIEQMKVDILNEINNGQFITDNKCIVISAPKIIIGNVSKDGTLKHGGGEVIIKGSAIGIDGVGQSANITMRAPVIQQSAIDPGIDGKEAVVWEGSSKITAQARTVIIDSHSPAQNDYHQGTFLPLAGSEGVTIASETGITLAATKSSTEKEKAVNDQKTKLDSEISELTGPEKIQKKEAEIAKDITDMNEILKAEIPLTADRDLTQTNILAIDELNYRLKNLVPQFSQHLLEYAALVSELAELQRQKACMTTEVTAIENGKANFETETTGTRLTLKSENIDILSQDGDNNWRTNEGAGIDIRANDIKLRSMTADTNNHPHLTPLEAKASVTIQSRNVSITTADITDQTYDADGKLKKAHFPLQGDVTIQSKTINLESVDLEQTDVKKKKEIALTAGGEINLRANKVKVKTINEKGESVGKFSVNSQKISMKATNIDSYNAEYEIDDYGNLKKPEHLKSKELAKGSEMLLTAENLSIGYKNDNIVSMNTTLFADNNLYVGSGGKIYVLTQKSGLWIDDNIKLTSDNEATVRGGKVKVNGETTFDSKLTGQDIQGENITANKAVKAPNIGDGIPISIPAPPQKPQKNPTIPTSDL
ncbi:MAG: hypothetical protein J5552_06110 [Prevotella sp.]|nr:hypothetical protein [Prevotella sp.]